MLCLSTSYHLSSFSSHLNCCLTLPRCSPVDSAGLLSCKSGPGYIGPDGGAFTPCPKGTIQSLSLLIKIVGNHSRVHARAFGQEHTNSTRLHVPRVLLAARRWTSPATALYHASPILATKDRLEAHSSCAPSPVTQVPLSEI